MQRVPISDAQRDRIAASLPFVEALARRVASSMPHSIELGDLVQDGMIGLIDAAHRFDESRGIKFETFAERRVRGAMIDALRKDAWPRGVRRLRRELEAARETLRRELGCEPSIADLAARVGADEERLGRAIVRINTIESTSPLAAADGMEDMSRPAILAPPETPSPDQLYEEDEVRRRVRAAIALLPPRERKVIGLYYFREVTMKEIGATIGVNESRVSQLHARAVQRLRQTLAASDAPDAMPVVLQFAPTAKKRVAKAAASSDARGSIVPYPTTSRATRSRSASLKGLGSHRLPLSSRKRSASVPATSPVTKMIRRASAGVAAVAAR
jgi:RNA polymerase sigma factor for flagellar operon FliA